MNDTLRAIEEGRVRERLPVTYAVMKHGDPQKDGVLHWLQWYAEDPDPADRYHHLCWPVYAQVGWERDVEFDVCVGTFISRQLAENAANSHTLILENVQRADFAKARA